MNKKCIIAPSILSADFTNLGLEIEKIMKAGADWIHIDVMDGNFVPNISFGSPIIKALRPLTNSVFDVHLMVENSENYIDEYAKIGCDIITIHFENNYHLHKNLTAIRHHGKKAGIALNPATSISCLEPILDYVDLILVMSVNPGFGGQTFIPQVIPKITKIKDLIADRPIDLEVDGGITEQTIGQAAKSGANAFVAGSYIMNSNDYADRINKLRLAAKGE